MSVEFRPSTQQDVPAIAQLLQAAFNSAPDAPYLNHELLNWKYFEPDGASESGSRSYVLAQNGKLLAHGCAWPVCLRTTAGKRAAVCLLDWAGAKGAPGMGIQLARKMAGLAPILLSIGGSEMTRQIMPRIGFRPRGELLSYARVMRPFRQFRIRSERRGTKSILRVIRNTVWSLAPLASTQDLSWSKPGTNLHDQRLEYLLRCPGAKLSLFELFKSGRSLGTVLLSLVGGQSRIARLQIPCVQSEEWKAVYAAAATMVSEDPKACECMALAPNPSTAQALEANGFRLRNRRTVFVSDPEGLLSEADFPLKLDMLDDDMAYLNVPDYPFLT